MNEESTTSGLNAEKLRRIWDIGSDEVAKGPELDPDEKRAALLRDWLSNALPLDPDLADLLPTVLSRLFRDLKPFVGESFKSLILDPDTDISAIKKIKDFGKKLVESVESEAEHDAAATIYYAAIASALAHHDRKITSFSYEQLRDFFSSMADKTWLTRDLQRLFKKAHVLCHKRAKGKRKQN